MAPSLCPPPAMLSVLSAWVRHRVRDNAACLPDVTRVNNLSLEYARDYRSRGAQLIKLGPYGPIFSSLSLSLLLPRNTQATPGKQKYFATWGDLFCEALRQFNKVMFYNNLRQDCWPRTGRLIPCYIFPRGRRPLRRCLRCFRRLLRLRWSLLSDIWHWKGKREERPLYSRWMFSLLSGYIAPHLFHQIGCVNWASTFKPLD